MKKSDSVNNSSQARQLEENIKKSLDYLDQFPIEFKEKYLEILELKEKIEDKKTPKKERREAIKSLIKTSKELEKIQKTITSSKKEEKAVESEETVSKTSHDVGIGTASKKIANDLLNIPPAFVPKDIPHKNNKDDPEDV